MLAGEVLTPPAGAVGRGDAFVLQIAERSGATVLSNDSFQEFHATYEWLFDDGRLWGGKPVPGVGWVFVARVSRPWSGQPTSHPRRQEGADGQARRTGAASAAGDRLHQPRRHLAKQDASTPRAAKAPQEGAGSEGGRSGHPAPAAAEAVSGAATGRAGRRAARGASPAEPINSPAGVPRLRHRATTSAASSTRR